MSNFNFSPFSTQAHFKPFLIWSSYLVYRHKVAFPQNLNFRKCLKFWPKICSMEISQILFCFFCRIRIFLGILVFQCGRNFHKRPSGLFCWSIPSFLPYSTVGYPKFWLKIQFWPSHDGRNSSLDCPPYGRIPTTDSTRCPSMETWLFW